MSALLNQEHLKLFGSKFILLLSWDPQLKRFTIHRFTKIFQYGLLKSITQNIIFRLPATAVSQCFHKRLWLKYSLDFAKTCIVWMHFDIWYWGENIILLWQWLDQREKIEYMTARNMQGLHMPMKLSMERFAAKQVGLQAQSRELEKIFTWVWVLWSYQSQYWCRCKIFVPTFIILDCTNYAQILNSVRCWVGAILQSCLLSSGMTKSEQLLSWFYNLGCMCNDVVNS